MTDPGTPRILSRLRSLPRRVWLLVLVVTVLAIGGAITAVAFNAAAEQAAAEQAAAEQAAAEKAAAEKAATEKAAAERAAAERQAARLASAKKDAAETAVQGESRYADSLAWTDDSARVDLRAALDALMDVQSDSSANAEDLESSIDAVARAIEVVGDPPSPVSFICGDINAGVDYTVHHVDLNPHGSGQYADIWAAQLRCDNSMTGDSVEETVRIQTPMQKAAVAAAKEAGYEEFNDSDEEILYSVYMGCAASGPASYYSEATALSDSQAKEVKAYLTICPDHPDVEQWRIAIAAGEEEREAEANGTRIPPSGTYEVPSEMPRGTFIAESVKNCYWETRDADGNIIDNNFVIAAPRVVAEVTSDAVVFTTDGSCGYWNRQ